MTEYMMVHDASTVGCPISMILKGPAYAISFCGF
jgi:hypothetical protein